MPDFRVALVGATLVRPTDVLVGIIEGALAPIAAQAGRTLNLWRPESAAGAAGAELTLTFVSRSAVPVRLGEQFVGSGPIRLIFGDEGGGSVFVGSMLELRVGGPPRLTATPPGAGFRHRGADWHEVPHRGLQRDYFANARSVFSNGERAFAEFAANVALHEAGHIVAALPHSTDIFNYMVDGQAMRPGAWRSWENVRRFWSGHKTFDDVQATQLAEHIASGSFAGGMTTSTAEATQMGERLAP